MLMQHKRIIPYVPADVWLPKKRSYEIIMVKKKIICTFHNKFVQYRRAGAYNGATNVNFLGKKKKKKKRKN